MFSKNKSDISEAERLEEIRVKVPEVGRVTSDVGTKCYSDPECEIAVIYRH